MFFATTSRMLDIYSASVLEAISCVYFMPQIYVDLPQRDFQIASADSIRLSKTAGPVSGILLAMHPSFASILGLLNSVSTCVRNDCHCPPDSPP